MLLERKKCFFLPLSQMCCKSSGKLPPDISLGFRWCHAQLMNLNVILTCFFLKFFKILND